MIYWLVGKWIEEADTYTFDGQDHQRYCYRSTREYMGNLTLVMLVWMRASNDIKGCQVYPPTSWEQKLRHRDSLLSLNASGSQLLLFSSIKGNVSSLSTRPSVCKNIVTLSRAYFEAISQIDGTFVSTTYIYRESVNYGETDAKRFLFFIIDFGFVLQKDLLYWLNVLYLLV